MKKQSIENITLEGYGEATMKDFLEKVAGGRNTTTPYPEETKLENEYSKEEYEKYHSRRIW